MTEMGPIKNDQHKNKDKTKKIIFNHLKAEKLAYFTVYYIHYESNDLKTI